MYGNKIQEAIAQLLGVDSQVIEIIEPYIGEDLGKGDIMVIMQNFQYLNHWK